MGRRSAPQRVAACERPVGGAGAVPLAGCVVWAGGGRWCCRWHRAAALLRCCRLRLLSLIDACIAACLTLLHRRLPPPRSQAASMGAACCSLLWRWPSWPPASACSPLPATWTRSWVPAARQRAAPAACPCSTSRCQARLRWWPACSAPAAAASRRGPAPSTRCGGSTRRWQRRPRCGRPVPRCCRRSCGSAARLRREGRRRRRSWQRAHASGRRQQAEGQQAKRRRQAQAQQARQEEQARAPRDELPLCCPCEPAHCDAQSFAGRWQGRRERV